MKDMSALLVFTLALSFAVSAIAEPVRIAVKPGESLAAARDAVRALPREIGLRVDNMVYYGL